MPQLDPTWFASQFFWLIICFGVMLFLMSKIVIPRIAEVVDDRNKRVDDDLSRAEELKEQADAVFEKYSEQIASAKTNANLILEEAKEEMLAFSKEKGDEVEKRLAKMIVDGEEQITKVKQEAMLQIKDIVCETSALSASKIVGEEVDSSKVNIVVEKVVEAKS
jgi:F-type H+-transporting ATPase subunit b